MPLQFWLNTLGLKFTLAIKFFWLQRFFLTKFLLDILVHLGITFNWTLCCSSTSTIFQPEKWVCRCGWWYIPHSIFKWSDFIGVIFKKNFLKVTAVLRSTKFARLSTLSKSRLTSFLNLNSFHISIGIACFQGNPAPYPLIMAFDCELSISSAVSRYNSISCISLLTTSRTSKQFFRWLIINSSVRTKISFLIRFINVGSVNLYLWFLYL